MRLMLCQYIVRTIVFFASLSSCVFAQRHISPDGKHYIYWDEQNGNRDIFLINLDGTGKTRLTDHPYQDHNPQWFPDGKRICFYRKHLESREANLFVYDVDRKRESRLTSTPHYDGDPSPSPDGTYLAFTSDRDGDFEIFTMALDSVALAVQVTFNDVDDFSPNWSPDGKRIVFVSKRTGTHELFVMDVDGSNPKRLTQSGTDNYKPTFSADGSRIAFFSKSNGSFDAFVINADGRESRNLTNTPNWDEFTAGWLLGSETILFHTTQTGYEGLYSIQIDSLIRQLLIPKSLF